MKVNNQYTVIPDELERAIQSAVESLTEKYNLRAIRDDPEVLTVKQAAQFLGLSPSTIYTYISKRSIPFVKRNGSVWFLRSRLIQWLEEGERKTLTQLSK